MGIISVFKINLVLTSRLVTFVLFGFFSFYSFASVDLVLLSTETNLRLERVPEFVFIKNVADKMGIKVYLFGGTAAAFAHYVRWDLEREAGDHKYAAEKFDYDFTNIYRGNQDLDLVIDGTELQAQKLKAELLKEYPHFVGDKLAWEIRLLRQNYQEKSALLGDFNFLNQHTDTNSTGLIVINPDNTFTQNSNLLNFIYRDLFDWENPSPRFLNDVANGEIHFLFSPNHSKTQRYLEGKNPPIFAALRYLAKLAQYEVKGPLKDLEIIKSIIDQTDWSRLSGYVQGKLSEFAIKTLLNSPNSEYAWKLLDELGLRKKLIALDGNQIQKENTLSWWLNKEPLRSKLIGQGNGKLVSDISKEMKFKFIQNELPHIVNDKSKDIFASNGGLIVSHETNSFAAYENITRSARGEANAFISRQYQSGEAAALGDGFYTLLGKKGARNTGLTIRFILNPGAREGTDFIRSGDIFVIKNKAALSMIQENLNIGLIDFLKLIGSNSIGPNEKGLLEKLKRKMSRIHPESKQFKDAKQFLLDILNIHPDFPEQYSLKKMDPDLYQKILNANDFESLVSIYNLRMKYYQNLLKAFGEIKNVSSIDAKWLKYIIEHYGLAQDVIQYTMSKPAWIKYHKFLNLLIKNDPNAELAIIIYLLDRPSWKIHLEKIVPRFLKNPNLHYRLASVFRESPYWNDHPEYIEAMIKQGKVIREVIDILAEEHWSMYPHLVRMIFPHDSYGVSLSEKVFAHSYWLNQTELVKDFILSGTSRHIHFINLVLKNHFRPDLVSFLIKNTTPDPLTTLITEVLYKPEWYLYPEFIEEILKKATVDPVVINWILFREHWTKHPELLMMAIENGNSNWNIENNLLIKDYWNQHPVLLQYLNGKSITLQNLIERQKEIKFVDWQVQESSTCQAYL